MKALPFLFCIFSFWGYSQIVKPTDKEALIHLSITDLQGKPFQSEVVFKSPKKEYKAQTDSKGKVDLIIPIGLSYKIKISNSETYYDYDIEDYPGQDIDLPLKFNLAKSNNNDVYATDDKALLVLSSFNLPKEKEIEIIDEKSKTKLASTKSDTFKIALPISNTYRIKINGFIIKNDIITIDNTPQNVVYHVLHISDSIHATVVKSKKESFFNIVYTDIFSKKPVPNEKIVMVSKKNKKQYNCITGMNGTCLMQVPSEDTYSINLTFDKNVIVKNIENIKGTSVFSCVLLYPSTKYQITQKKEDSLRIAKRDSAYKKTGSIEIRDNSAQLKKLVNKDLEDMKLKIKDNPNYFKEIGNVVCAVLYRIQKRWNSKMIVTDLTGSMYPYMLQILQWHEMKLMTNEDNDYVFFNDGDNKFDAQKIIGNTGGLYYTASNDVDTIISKMFETMRNGSGGDAPENDIEALLFAKIKKKNFSELILIADNFAPVKDISLLEKLNIPVRIILCGTGWGINPQYLEIAYKTKGSIHTINDDILTLGTLVDGKTITIDGKTYTYSNGKFFKQTNL